MNGLYQELKGEYEMYGNGGWINNKLRVIGRLLEKFGLYVGHLKDSTSSAKNSAARATLLETFKKLVDAKVLPRSAFFTEVLAEAKKLSLLTQEL